MSGAEWVEFLASGLFTVVDAASHRLLDLLRIFVSWPVVTLLLAIVFRRSLAQVAERLEEYEGPFGKAKMKGRDTTSLTDGARQARYDTERLVEEHEELEHAEGAAGGAIGTPPWDDHQPGRPASDAFDDAVIDKPDVTVKRAYRRRRDEDGNLRADNGNAKLVLDAWERVTLYIARDVFRDYAFTVADCYSSYALNYPTQCVRHNVLPSSWLTAYADAWQYASAVRGGALVRRDQAKDFYASCTSLQEDFANAPLTVDEWQTITQKSYNGPVRKPEEAHEADTSG